MTAPAPSRPAPFRADLAEGPDGAEAVWLTAADGLKIRAAHWPGGAAGTVVLLPGRSEYAEKYGRVARDVVARGWHLVAIDWRGQGMSDRLLADPFKGHVAQFGDYQHDLDAVLDMVRMRGLPAPLVMLAHSMGGCIGRRTLGRDHPFTAAVFSAPMWGIAFAPSLKRVAATLPLMASRLGLGHHYTPTTAPSSYFMDAPFEGNVLTTDRDHWDYMVRQATAEPQFRLGGPSLGWLAEALAEFARLDALPPPALPAHASVGEMEKVVDPAAVARVIAGWPRASFFEAPGAEHELMMERPATRAAFLDRAFATFAEGSTLAGGQAGGPSRQGRSTA